MKNLKILYNYLIRSNLNYYHLIWIKIELTDFHYFMCLYVGFSHAIFSVRKISKNNLLSVPTTFNLLSKTILDFKNTSFLTGRNCVRTHTQKQRKKWKRTHYCKTIIYYSLSSESKNFTKHKITTKIRIIFY